MCVDDGEARCTDMACDESAECGIKDGVRDCYCKEGFVGDGIECQRGMDIIQGAIDLYIDEASVTLRID